MAHIILGMLKSIVLHFSRMQAPPPTPPHPQKKIKNKEVDQIKIYKKNSIP